MAVQRPVFSRESAGDATPRVRIKKVAAPFVTWAKDIDNLERSSRCRRSCSAHARQPRLRHFCAIRYSVLARGRAKKPPEINATSPAQPFPTRRSRWPMQGTSRIENALCHGGLGALARETSSALEVFPRWVRTGVSVDLSAGIRTVRFGTRLDPVFAAL